MRQKLDLSLYVTAAVVLRKKKSGYGGEKLDLKDEKYQEVRETYLTRRFINSTLYIIPLQRLN
jgi:hypothetical protein